MLISILIMPTLKRLVRRPIIHFWVCPLFTIARYWGCWCCNSKLSDDLPMKKKPSSSRSVLSSRGQLLMRRLLALYVNWRQRAVEKAARQHLKVSRVHQGSALAVRCWYRPVQIWHRCQSASLRTPLRSWKFFAPHWKRPSKICAI